MHRLVKVALTTAVVATLALAPIGVAASILNAPGYIVQDTVIDMPAYSFLGGFDLLPNGNLVINDGCAIREVAPNGSQGSSLYTFGSPVSGSFVRYHSGKLYFGDSTTESSNIWSMPLSGGPAALLATLQGNFDMDFSGDVPYVVAGSTIYKLTDAGPQAVAGTDGYSGPLAFDSAGNLYYSPSYYPKSTSVFRWTAAQLASGSVLGKSDAASLTTLGGAYGFVFDHNGRLLLTDNSGVPALRRWDGTSLTTIATFALTDTSYPSLTFIREDAMHRIVVGASYYDSNWVSHTFISTLTVPEPSSALALLSLIGLAASAKLLRLRGK